VKTTYFRDFYLLNPGSEPQKRIIRHAYVIVHERRIIHCGEDREAAEKCWSSLQLQFAANMQIYEGYGKKLLLPAFINCHTHLVMSLFRNSADDQNLHDWLFQTIFPLENKLRERDYRIGTQLACLELIKNGIAATFDMYARPDLSIPEVMRAGLRYLPGIDDKVRDKDFKASIDKNIIAKMQDLAQAYPQEQLKLTYMIHSIYLYQNDFFPQAADYLAANPQLLLQMHLCETQKEYSDCLKRFGKSPVKQMDEFRLLGKGTVAAHCVVLTDEDRDILAKRQVTVVHNPTSNLKLGSGIADIKALLQQQIRVCLGSDGAASNNNLNLYNEMKLAALLSKGQYRRADIITAFDVLQMATCNGYKAAGLGAGVIKEGELADIQVVNLDSVNTFPINDLAAAVVYSLQTEQVESLMVLGQFVYYKKEYLTLDVEKIKYEAAKCVDFLHSDVQAH